MTPSIRRLVRVWLVAAGLVNSFVIVWPPKGHAATCPAFTQGEPP